jgi:hypothetical protein
MNSGMNSTDASGSPVIGNHELVVLDSSSVKAMRHRLHELANVFTGMMIAAGLLSQYLEAGSLGQHAKDIAEDGERGCALVRELRSQLLAACGETEAASPGDADGAIGGQEGNQT